MTSVVISGLGLVVAVALMFGLAYWMLEAQLEFFRQYRTRFELDKPFEHEEMWKRYRRAPWRFLMAVTPWTRDLQRVTSVSLADPELERLRRRYQTRKALLYLSTLVAFGIIVAATSIARQQ